MEKKIILLLSIISIIALASVLILGNFVKLSLVIQGIEPFEKVENWNGIDVTIKSAYIGELVDRSLNAFCNSNDGRNKVSNSYTLGDTLSLSSSMTAGGLARSSECGENYITVSFIAPKGDIEVYYTLLSTSSKYDTGNSYASISLDEEVKSTHTCDPNTGGCNFGVDSKTGKMVKTYLGGEKVDIKIFTSKSTNGASSVSSTIRFNKETIKEDEVIQEEVILPKENEESNIYLPYLIGTIIIVIILIIVKIIWRNK